MSIDVIIPVYRGIDQTRRCIESALQSIPAGTAEVIVVDDATPEPPIAAYLDELAAAARITLLRNDANTGFVRSVNRGMSLHEDRDVVLLNSDTEVANDWLERLRAAAYRQQDIATVTPFSNNATICSYPFWGWSGGTPGTRGVSGLDQVFARANAGQAVDIPTAVGFCMYIRRDALRALGLFDAERFGRGYGEENDFCMRAIKSGWRNVLAGDVFVYHEGSVSFSAESEALMQAASAALLAVHPDYSERVQAFVDADPVQPLRSSVDLARIQLDSDEAHHVLRERHHELSRFATQMRELQKSTAAREAHIEELHQALAHATAIVKERNEAIAAYERGSAAAREELGRLNEEIVKLREGLAYAESLAFAREKELAEMRSRLLWRAYFFVRRRISKA
jgi:GT2 family glycosyltransferase